MVRWLCRSNSDESSKVSEVKLVTSNHPNLNLQKAFLFEVCSFYLIWTTTIESSPVIYTYFVSGERVLNRIGLILPITPTSGME